MESIDKHGRKQACNATDQSSSRCWQADRHPSPSSRPPLVLELVGLFDNLFGFVLVLGFLHFFLFFVFFFFLQFVQFIDTPHVLGVIVAAVFFLSCFQDLPELNHVSSWGRGWSSPQGTLRDLN